MITGRKMDIYAERIRKMRIWLARHGETDWNTNNWIQGHTNTDLNETGRQQAAFLGQRILEEKLPITKIYASTLKRSQQTAQIAAKIAGVPCLVEAGLEEISLGAWEGMTWKEAAEAYPKETEEWNRDRRYNTPPGGECYQDVLDRMVAAIRRICDRETEDVLIVTHAGSIRILLTYVNGTEFTAEAMKQYQTPNGSIRELDLEKLWQVEGSE